MTKNLPKISLDAIIYSFAFVLAYWVRFDGRPPDDYFRQLQYLLVGVVGLRLLTNFALGVYRQLWSYFSLNDLLTLSVATTVPSALFSLGRLLLTPDNQIWRISLGITFIDFLLALGGAISVRLLRRLWFERSETRPGRIPLKAKSSRVLLVGAGEVGIMVAKEARKKKNLNWDVVGFVDDNPEKLNTTIHGTNVIGKTADIPALVQTRGVDRVIIAIANASSKDIRRIVETCEAMPIPVKIVPGLFEILDDKVSIKKLRDVNIDDLLGREVTDFKGFSANIKKYFHGKRILVTGAGGSIGSEICRQLGAFVPSELILLDKHENSLYEIDRKLEYSQPHIARRALLCDIRDDKRLSSLLHFCRPQVIFHAAANKQVPLMEENSLEAVTTNIQGTVTLLNLAEEVHCERFVMLSTDKAVNPKSIMGACKRVVELIIQTSANKKTLFSCVRFGNVLGSNGSVVEVFRTQIQQGGPLIITDRNATRFFMTIPEAVQLVIRAATLGSKGEIYVLDMGKPVRILDLAQDMINLSGLSDKAIEIHYTGLRPGEKLQEELFYPYEEATPTVFPKIVSLDPIDIDCERFSQELEAFLKDCTSMQEEVLRQRLFSLVSSSIPSEASQSAKIPLRSVKN
ncbi:MAG: nucleoside-diphosphate sugar epimerase/dehydratase [Verrucomicrobia bacterium]|nr:nucleoside-diphosphate sugar epimerase/dehydratase [Verrucomicrobiota bacterium]